MFEVLEESSNYLFVRSHGKLLHADYEGLLASSCAPCGTKSASTPTIYATSNAAR
jgi:hypothetical protein